MQPRACHRAHSLHQVKPLGFNLHKGAGHVGHVPPELGSGVGVYGIAELLGPGLDVGAEKRRC
jgi:hypothetical protein